MNQDDYYRASSYGISAAVLMWHLASDLGKEDNALLWHAIVGLTDQFLHDRIDVRTCAFFGIVRGPDGGTLRPHPNTGERRSTPIRVLSRGCTLLRTLLC